MGPNADMVGVRPSPRVVAPPVLDVGVSATLAVRSGPLGSLFTEPGVPGCVLVTVDLRAWAVVP